jgi:hypothetical protein
VNVLLIAKAVRAYYDKNATVEYHRELMGMLTAAEFDVYYEATTYTKIGG